MDGIGTALVTGITSIASNVGTAIGDIIPVALPIVGIGIIVAVGLKVFKKVANK